MSIKSQDQIRANIQSELSDNNAGLISAYDVRHNMEDIVDSINQIVASGDFDAATPFTGSNIRAKISNNQYGSFIVESGIIFPNANGGVQYEAYPGTSGVQHNALAGLTVGDPHTQYLPLGGGRVMQDNLGMGANWINASGNSDIVSSDNRGIKFETLSSTQEYVHVGNNTTFVFDVDTSKLASSKGVAKAWINFNGSGTIAVRDSYNIKQIERVDSSVGKYKITFMSGVLANNNYVAIASSNARSDNDSGEDFGVNTVGIVQRIGDDTATLRSLTFYVLNDAGQYVDAAVNDLVVFGREQGASSGVQPIIVN
jgi:hypothetical protein